MAVEDSSPSQPFDEFVPFRKVQIKMDFFNVLLHARFGGQVLKENYCYPLVNAPMVKSVAFFLFLLEK